MRRTLIPLLVTALWGRAARGADDLTPLTGPTLPMPTPAPTVVLPSGPVSFYLPNRMDVWQNYGVDRQGRWVPRVIMTGDATFYYFNGRPYPGVPVNQRYVMPYLFD